MQTSASIWKNPEYLKFFSSYTIGNIGDWFDFFALQLIFAHYFNASPLALSLLLIVYMAPMAMFGAFAGIVVDKFNKKKVLIITDFVAGVMTVGLIFSHAVALSLLLVFIRSTFASLNAPAQQATLKYLVTEEQLLAANGYNSVVFQLCKVVGPFLGALIVAAYTPKWCLVINAISFFVSVFILLSLKSVVEIPTQIESVRHILRQSKEAWHFLMRASALLKTMMQVTLGLFIFLMMGFSQVVLLLKHLFPQDPSILGVFMAVSGVGSLITGAWMSQKKKITNYAGYLSVSFLLIALNYGLLGVYQAHWGVYPVYLLSLIDGLGFGIAVVLYGYVMQKETPQTHMGRVSGLAGMLQGIVFVIGSLLGGVVVELLGIRMMFVLVGIACLFVVMLVLSRRKVLC